MVLLIDNYDSFTFNLFDYIKQLGYKCQVIRNDELNLSQINEINFDNIIISPGPCTPSESGICMELIQEYYETKPILGICLGHQALGQFFNAKLEKALVPMHGKTSSISLSKHPLFKELSTQIEVMRYHSLILTQVGQPLEIIAQTSLNEVMAMAHQTLPIAGVQFHPESILTKDGLQILKNWFDWIK